MKTRRAHTLQSRLKSSTGSPIFGNPAAFLNAYRKPAGFLRNGTLHYKNIGNQNFKSMPSWMFLGSDAPVMKPKFELVTPVLMPLNDVRLRMLKKSARN